MFEKRSKGQYGYRRYHRKIQLAKTIFGAAMILVQLSARMFTDNEAARNILTVMAILSVLPTANVASPLLASWRYVPMASELHEKLIPLEDKGILLYDLILTTKEQIIPADAAFVHPKAVLLYCPDGKLDAAKAEKALNGAFQLRKLDPIIKIISDEKQFLKRITGMKPASEYEDDGSVGYGADTLKSMSM